MERKLISAWVEALQSGKYAQTPGALCKLYTVVDPPSTYTDDHGYTVTTTTTRERKEYCCLGVLAEVAKSLGMFEGEFVGAEYSSSIGWNLELSWGGSTGTFNADGLKALGLTDHAQSILTELNDKGAPFVAIAAALDGIIEAGAAKDREINSEAGAKASTADLEHAPIS